MSGYRFPTICTLRLSNFSIEAHTHTLRRCVRDVVASERGLIRSNFRLDTLRHLGHVHVPVCVSKHDVVARSGKAVNCSLCEERKYLATWGGKGSKHMHLEHNTRDIGARSEVPPVRTVDRVNDVHPPVAARGKHIIWKRGGRVRRNGPRAPLGIRRRR